jgi:ABC-type nitrate/sulfonate/bicarbonate transport system substrate-binding protein
MRERTSVESSRRQVLRTGIGAGIAALGLPAFLRGRDARAQARSPIPVAIAWQPATTIPQFYAAEKYGLFEQTGLTAKYLKFLSGPAIFASLKGGDVDIAEMGTVPAIVGRSQGIPMKIVALSGDGSATYFLVARPGIKGMSDLRGKKVVAITGSNYHFVLAKSLEKAGMTFKDIQHLNLSTADTAPAFKNGDVDAVWHSSPWPEKLVEVGGVKVTDAAKLGILAPSIWVARADWVKRHPDGLARWMRAMELGYAAFQRDPAAIIAIAAERMGTPAADIEPILKATRFSSFKEQVSSDHPLSLTRGFPNGDAGLARFVKEQMEFLTGLQRLPAPYPPADVIDPTPAQEYVKSQA